MNKHSLLPYDMSLILMLGTTLLVAETKNVVTALTMTVTVTIIMIIASIIASLLKGKLDEKLKYITYVIIIAGLCGIFEMLIEAFIPTAFENLTDYLPVIAASVLVYDAINMASQNDVKTAVSYAFNTGLRLILIGLICGCIRELLASGSIFGLTLGFLDNYHISVFGSVAGGFIVTGIVAALLDKKDDAQSDSFIDVIYNSKKEEK